MHTTPTLVLENWGPCPVQEGEPGLGNVDGDDQVGIVDFLAMLAAWGDCP